MTASIDLSQEVLVIDMLTAVKSFLDHNRRQLLRLYGNQALARINLSAICLILCSEAA